MNRPAEDWGRIAVSLPGWRWMPGMLTDCGERVTHSGICYLGTLPDPDDPATEGCMVRLLGHARRARQALHAAGHHDEAHRLHIAFMLGRNIGRSCIAAAEALGRWPNGGRMVAE